MTFEVIAVVIRQFMPWALLVADSFGCEREGIVWGWSPCFFIMTHIDSVPQNIQLVSNLLCSYWSTTSEYPSVLSRSFSHLKVFRILLDGVENNGTSQLSQQGQRMRHISKENRRMRERGHQSNQTKE